MLTSAELSRYSRQITLPELGVEGQQRLHAASVLIVGAGGLGSPVALYLAAAGVGHLGVVDDDVVELHNLHRQILHSMGDLGHAKAASASAAVVRLNPNVRVTTHTLRLDHANATSLIAAYDLVVDGSDNFPTRYAVNDACARLGKPWVYGSVERFSGQVSVFGAPGGPCYRCVYPEPPAPGSTPSCEDIGVLGAVPGVIGSLQAVEALKWLAHVGEPLAGRLLQLGMKGAEVRVVRIDRDPHCVACGDGGRSAIGVMPEAGAHDSDVEPAELAELLDQASPPLLLDVREPWEWAVGKIGAPITLSLTALEGRVDTLDRSRPLVVYCHHGNRSGLAAEWLRAQGFRARNLAGGIDRWSREVDPTVPRY